VNHTRHVVLVEDPLEEGAVEDRSARERDRAREEPELPGGEVVEHDRPEAGREELTDDVGADVAGAAGHEPGHASRVEAGQHGARR
jgi:hypothetical protein